MDPKDLNRLTKAELLALAKKLGVPVDSGTLKSALIRSIQRAVSSGSASVRRRSGARPRRSPEGSRARTRAAPGVGKRRSPRKPPVSGKRTEAEKAGGEASKTAPEKTGGGRAGGTRGRSRKAARRPEKTRRASKRRPAPGRPAPKIVPPPKSPVHLEEAAGGLEAKFLVAPPFAHDEARERPLPELPAGYGRARVVLLPRDPYWAFAYWEIPQKEARALLRRTGETWERVRWVLRLFSPDKTRAPEDAFFDVTIDPFAIGWYLHLSPPGTSFQAEIGLCDSRNRFWGLVCSNTMILPPDRPSDILDETWSLTDQDLQHHYGAYPAPGALPAGGRLVGEQSAGSFTSRPNPFDTR